MLIQQQRTLVACALGALAICAVFMLHENADDAQLESDGKGTYHAVAERNCFMRECSMKNGKESCVTKHHGCHAMPTQWMHSPMFFPRFMEHTTTRPTDEDDFDMGDMWRMPHIHLPWIRFGRSHRHFSQLAGSDKIKVVKSKKKIKQHPLTVRAGPAAGMTKKQIKAFKTYQKKLAAARKAYLKRVQAARKGLHLPKIHAQASATQGCFERQCVSKGGRMQCKTIKLKCGAGGMAPAAHMAKMLRKMFHGRQPKRPMVRVVRVRPMPMIDPKKLKAIRNAFKNAISPKALKKMKSKMKKIVGKKNWAAKKAGKPVHLTPKQMKQVRVLLKKTFTPKVVNKVKKSLKKLFGKGLKKAAKKAVKKANKKIKKSHF